MQKCTSDSLCTPERLCVHHLLLVDEPVHLRQLVVHEVVFGAFDHHGQALGLAVDGGLHSEAVDLWKRRKTYENPIHSS